MNILKFLYDNRTAVLMIAMAVIIMLLLNECNRSHRLKEEAKAEKQRSIQNLAAITDTIKAYINAAGDTSYQKPIAEMSLEEIKDNLPLLYEAIQAEGGQPKLIIREYIIYRDTGSVNNVLNELDDNQYALNFNYLSEDSILKLEGKSLFTAVPYEAADNKLGLNITPGKTIFDNTEIKFDLTTGIKKDKDGISRIFVTPSSSKIVISDIQGADLTSFLKEHDKSVINKKRFGIGLNIGYGAVFGKNNQMYHGPEIGIGINYSLVRF